MTKRYNRNEHRFKLIHCFALKLIIRNGTMYNKKLIKIRSWHQNSFLRNDTDILFIKPKT